jgi:uncharacterized membrane protein YeaQ/YmgE (transglycosylase-associated protein family)
MRMFIDAVFPCLTAIIGAVVLLWMTERELRAE